MKKDNKWIWGGIALLLIIGYFYFQPTWDFAKPGQEINLPEGMGLSAFFADAEQKEVKLTPIEEQMMSLVVMPGTAPVGGIFFMRYDTIVENTGSLAQEVWISDARIEDLQGNKLQESLVRSAFSCVLNQKITLEPGQSYTFSTEPGTGTCGSGVWIPTTYFEDVEQIRIIVTINTEFSMFGILREGRKEVEIQVGIGHEDDGFGTGTIGVIIEGGTDGYLEECDVGETRLCPFADVEDSVCYGVYQTCSGSGLWYGCPASLYGPDFVYGCESCTPNWRHTCTDGLDNDCDGVWDKPKTDGSCPRGDCDYDCPRALVGVRTNAPLSEHSEPTVDNSFANSDVWLAVLRNPEASELGLNDLSQFGYAHVGTMHFDACRDPCYVWEHPSGDESKNIGFQFLHKSPTSSTMRVIYPLIDLAGGTSCRVATFNEDRGGGCRVGDPAYPHCRSIFPIEIPYASNLQEVYIEYGAGYRETRAS